MKDNDLGLKYWDNRCKNEATTCDSRGIVSIQACRCNGINPGFKNLRCFGKPSNYMQQLIRSSIGPGNSYRYITYIFVVILYLIPLQELAGSILFTLSVPNVIIIAIISLKEILVIWVGFYCLLRLKLSSIRLYILFFLLFAILHYVIFSRISLSIMLVGLRTYLLFLLSFAMGEAIAKYKKSFPIICKHVVIIFFCVVIFGFLEHYVLAETIWTDNFPIFQMRREAINQPGENEMFDSGMPVNAYTTKGKRMLGPFDEPLYMAYFVVILVNIILAQYIATRRYIYLVLGILGIVIICLTQTRAVIFGLLFSCLILIFRKYVKYILPVSILLLFICIYIWGFFEFASYFFDPNDNRTQGHFLAYTVSLLYMLTNPIGVGVGAGSMAASLWTNDVGYMLSSENVYINIGIEIGLLGLFLFIVIWYKLIKLFNHYFDIYSINSNAAILASCLLVVQFLFAGLLAPHVMTARILIPFMIMVGWSYQLIVQRLPHREGRKI